MDFVVISACGRQYKVRVGQTVQLEKLSGEVGSAVEFACILRANGEEVVAGESLKASKVVGEIVGHFKDRKITVYKYKAKKNSRKKQGHRHQYTLVKIKEVV